MLPFTSRTQLSLSQEKHIFNSFKYTLIQSKLLEKGNVHKVL